MVTKFCCFVAGCAAVAGAQSARVEPRTVPQGGVVRIYANAASARMQGRTVRLFPQASGDPLGLMPVGALDKPGTFPLEIVDSDGKVVETAEVTVADAHFTRQNIALTPQIAGLKPAPGDGDAAEAFRTLISNVREWEDPPYPAPVAGCMGSDFGLIRMHNGKLTGGYHGGLDQNGATGDPIHAIASGTVRLVRGFEVSGNTVGVDHGQGVLSMYLHMSKFAVGDGAKVKEGEVIGYVGATGRVTGPHLHWSIFVNGVSVNPRGWTSVKPCAAAAPVRRRAPVRKQK